MDARRSPGRVLRHHPEDQVSNLFGDSFPPERGACSGDRAPIQDEPSPVPSHDRFRLHDYESLLPTRPKSPHKNPEKPIERQQLWPRVFADQDSELLPKNQIFEHEAATRAEYAKNR
jgi:hypothetical protein